MTTLHLVQMSGDAFDTASAARADVEANLARRPDALGLTEFSIKGHRTVAEAACKAHGYRLRGGDGDTAICLRGDHDLLAFASPRVHNGGTDSQGRYAARTLEILTADMYGERVTVTESHIVRGGTPTRVKHRTTTAKLIAQMLNQYAEGNNLAFGLMDANQADDAGKDEAGSVLGILKAAGLRTVYDELGYHPATGPGGSAIDVCVSANVDTRVRAVVAAPWPLLHSDHHSVSFVYSVGA